MPTPFWATSARGTDKFIVALEGKGPKDPLDRPFAGRRMSAVDQGYRYAINLPCDWIIVTSIRQTRLYCKGTDQQTYERFDTEQLAESDALLKRFVFLLGAARVVPETGRCHFYELLAESERVGKELTKEFYLRYADMRQDAFQRLCRDNPDVPRHDVLSCAQKLLDRVLFSAFCEDRGLAPHAKRSARRMNTATRITRARSGTTSAGCSRRSTGATRPWASTPTTAGCLPTIRSWTA